MTGYDRQTRSGKRNLGLPQRFPWLGGRLRGAVAWAAAAALILGAACSGAVAAPAHGVAMHGAPALPEGFAHLPYARPDAPEGGRLTLGELGGFDSLNPYVVKGRPVWAVRTLTVESLMGRNWDEPFALYGLLAETVEIPQDRAWVEFRLRPEARFSDGTRVTVEDVVWSLETLGELGRPGYRTLRDRIAGIERPAPGVVRFRFAEPGREAPLILGLMPVLSKAAHEGRAFGEGSLEPLVGSGPYVVAEAEAGRHVTFRRDPDWWGEGLAFNAGRWNFETIRHEWFRDGAALFEAFRAGEIDVFREGDPDRWEDGWGWAEAAGVERAEIPHGRPSGMTGFVFNTRRAPFDDIRVRRALTLAFDFEWINRTLNRGVYERIRSPFGGSPLAHQGPAEGRERAILAPHAEALPAGALEGTAELPETDGSGRDRRNLRSAVRLLEAAGWTVRDGALRDAEGRAFRFEILLEGPAWEAAASVFARALEPLGIEATVRLVDGAQYEARRLDYDYDMIVNRWAMSLSPGAEQRLYWGAYGRETPGTRNYAGVDSAAVEASIDALLVAETEADFDAAARALDRALAWGAYVVPLWHAPASRIGWDGDLAFPERLPLYGDWIGWLPDVWWREEAE